MKKQLRQLLIISAFLAILLYAISAFAAPATISSKKQHFPIISEKVKQKTAAGEDVPVLIKIKEEWELPTTKKNSTAAGTDQSSRKQNIKRLQKKALAHSFSSAESKKNIKVIHTLENIPWMTGKINSKAIEKLKNNPNVAIISEDVRLHVQLAESGPLISSDDVHTSGYTGDEVTVAVIDSGIDTDHPDLQDDLLWEECFLYHGCPGTTGFGGTRASGPGSAEDGLGHGTHVSGIITSGHPTYQGVAPDAEIVALKVFDDSGNGWYSDTLAALDWVVSNKEAYDISVINMSLGTVQVFAGDCDASSEASAAAVDAAKAAGIVLFASAGNAAESGAMSEPACLSSVISVGAVYDADIQTEIVPEEWTTCIDPQTAADQIPCFSNVSDTLDILAPGAIIDSTAKGGGIIHNFGTSMASPHAAGLAALLLQKNPFLSPDDIESILASTGNPIYDARIDDFYPRVEAVAALNATPEPNPSLTLTTTGPGSGTVTGAGTYNYRDVVTVSATADSGSAFDSWDGPDAAECTTGSVSMTADKSCVATFVIDNCPADPLKTEPGSCGCGVSDADTDGDSTLDCFDSDDDNDGMPDVYEQAHGFDPLTAADAGSDPDNDGLNNLEEYNLGTLPLNPDTDNDGVADGYDGQPFDDQQSACPVLIRNSQTLANFLNIQSAIDDPAALDYGAIQVTAGDYDEDILYDRNIIMTLAGGYTCSYSNNPSTTSIYSLTIKAGIIMADGITIQAHP